jgi:hypothetical protein
VTPLFTIRKAMSIGSNPQHSGYALIVAGQKEGRGWASASLMIQSFSLLPVG